MTGKNVNIWLYSFLCIFTCLVITGCSDVGANKRTNPVASETDSETNVSTGSASWRDRIQTTRRYNITTK